MGNWAAEGYPPNCAMAGMREPQGRPQKRRMVGVGGM